MLLSNDVLSNDKERCLINFFRVIDPSGHHSRKRSMSSSSRHGDHLKPVNEEAEDSTDDSDDDTASLTPKNKRDELVNPYWIEDPDVGKGEVEYLNSHELQFWRDLLEKYLYPLDENKEEKVCNEFYCAEHFDIFF